MDTELFQYLSIYALNITLTLSSQIFSTIQENTVKVHISMCLIRLNWKMKLM